MSVVVPGFPEITAFEESCRLCNLGRTHPEALKQAHSWFRQHGREGLAERTDQRVQALGEEPIDAACYAEHFAFHVEWYTSKPMAIEPAMRSRFDEDERALRASFEDEQADAQGIDQRDYVHVARLFKRMIRRLDALDADPSVFLTPDNRVDFHAYGIWTRMVAQAESAMKTLNKMRGSDKVVEAIVEYHTRTFAQGAARELAVELRVLKNEISKLPNSGGVVAAIDALLVDRLPVLFRAAAGEAHVKTRDHFKEAG